MGLRPPVWRLVRSVPMTSVGSLPRMLFTVTGPSPRCLTRPPGAPVRFLPLFTCVTFSTSFKVFALWVRSWQRVRGLSSPHLFSICSRGGGDSISPLSPRLRDLCGGYWLVWPALPVPVRVLGFPVLLFFLLHFIVFSLYVYFIYLYRVSQPK